MNAISDRFWSRHGQTHLVTRQNWIKQKVEHPYVIGGGTIGEFTLSHH